MQVNTKKRFHYMKPKALSLNARKIQGESKPKFKAECNSGGWGDPPKCTSGGWP